MSQTVITYIRGLLQEPSGSRYALFALPFIYRLVEKIIVVNASYISKHEYTAITSLNGTIVSIAKQNVFKDSQLNELLYVVIVIMFYAMALMILIATQIRKQRGNAEIEYYDEYLERNDRMKKKKKMLATITTVTEETSPKKKQSVFGNKQENVT